MARYYTYNAKLQGQMSAAVQCEHCAQKYNYSHKLRQLTTSENLGGRRPDPARSAMVAQKHQKILLDKYIKQILGVLAKGNYGYSKCPHCGGYQSWMVMALKRNRARKIALGMGFLTFLVLLVGEVLRSPRAFIEAILVSIPLVLAAALVSYRIALRFYNPRRPAEASMMMVNHPQITFNPGLNFNNPPPQNIEEPLKEGMQLNGVAFLILALIGMGVFLFATQAVDFQRPVLSVVLALIGGGLLAVALDFAIVPALHTLHKPKLVSQFGWTILAGGLIPVSLMAGMVADRALVEAEIVETLIAAANPVCGTPHPQGVGVEESSMGLVWSNGATNDVLGMGFARANEVSEIGTLLCVDQREATMETCTYSRDSNSESSGSITRIRYDWDIQVLDWTTGQILGRKSFAGATPEECPEEYWISSGDKSHKTYYGAPPDLSEVGSWVKGLRVTPSGA